MTDKELHDKLGALHLRLLDDEDNYIKMYNLLIDYSECCKNFGQSVNKALREGLQNHERYLKLDNALSPRSIIVEKKEGTDKASKSEGNYQIVFVLDDDSRHVIHFGRKQSHLLYILFLLCSRKNGLLTDFFQKDESREFDVIDVVALLAQLIFPSLRNKAKEARLSALELGPDKSFSDSLQKMKAPLVKCLKEAEMSDDLYWYMPFAVNLKKKQLYNMHMPSTKIILPAEQLHLLQKAKYVGRKAVHIERKTEHNRLRIPKLLQNACMIPRRAQLFTHFLSADEQALQEKKISGRAEPLLRTAVDQYCFHRSLSHSPPPAGGINLQQVLQFGKLLNKRHLRPFKAVIERIALSQIAEGILLRLRNFAIHNDFPEVVFSIAQRVVHLPAPIGGKRRGCSDGAVQNILDSGAVFTVQIFCDNRKLIRLSDDAADLLQPVLHKTFRRMLCPAAKTALAGGIFPICRNHPVVSA